MNAGSDSPGLARQAFVASLPVLMGYTTMGFVAGVLLGAKGNVALAPLWGFLTSALWVTGTMNFAFVPLIAVRASLVSFAILTLAVNFRYGFYGFSLVAKWRNVGFWRKLYLILMLTDENYALEAACTIADEKRYLRYCTLLSVMNHSYWVIGVTLGAIVVSLLGMVVDPDAIRRYTNGMEFAMVALFLVIFTDQMRAFCAGGKR